MVYRLLRRPWPRRKIYYSTMIPELACTVGLLVLFGLAQPNTYRTQMWQIGFNNGFNSNPNMILYAYANHAPLPKIPFVWSQALTDFNVAIAVLSLFVLIAKMIALIMHVFFPIFGLLMSIAMVALYATSVYGQAGPDYADARYPSPVAWYIAKSCSYAAANNVVTDCMMAKSSFAITVLMLAVYLANLGFAIWAMVPNKALDIEDEDSESDDDTPSSRKQWEMQPQAIRSPGLRSAGLRSPGLRSPGFGGAGGGGGGGVFSGGGQMASPFTPRTQAFNSFDRNASPFTPRTQAFHTLDRKLPLRA
ncbi:hypothetical protein SPBR_01885 [Sporothrix brasiliensis 5110]|uniref:Uncharacterized protein n=1 Tax=Sporothrix brasiliensis 5110 TaxID=1398154 RepID=A0A0C2EZG8_9PEZI|nr:uncharacterized protein SPBR_01885 [Sporothrix brasiliensis 5110]KIH91904.1 hypothetical protein SPBR_01885 [Sporothrix brasiliensis 5110]